MSNSFLDAVRFRPLQLISLILVSNALLVIILGVAFLLIVEAELTKLLIEINAIRALVETLSL